MAVEQNVEYVDFLRGWKSVRWVPSSCRLNMFLPFLGDGKSLGRPEALVVYLGMRPT